MVPEVALRSTHEAIVVHNLFGFTNLTSLHSVPYQSLVLGADTQTPCNTPIPRQIASQSGRVSQSSLSTIDTMLNLDVFNSWGIRIHHPEIRRRVYSLLENRAGIELWHVAHALHHLRREYFAFDSPLILDLKLILKDVEDSLLSAIEKATSHVCTARQNGNAVTMQEHPWLFHSIILLSFGAAATITQHGASHSAHLEEVFISPRDEVTLIFRYVVNTDLHRHIKVSNLSMLIECGVELELGPFSILFPGLDAQHRHHTDSQSSFSARERKPQIGKCDWIEAEKALRLRRECSKRDCYIPFTSSDYRNDESKQTQLSDNEVTFEERLHSSHLTGNDILERKVREQRKAMGKKIDQIEAEHFRQREWMKSRGEMHGNGVEVLEKSDADGNDGSESKNSTTASYESAPGLSDSETALRDCHDHMSGVQLHATSYDTCALRVKDDNVPRADEVHMTEMASEGQGVDEADWDADFDPRPILERSSLS